MTDNMKPVPCGCGGEAEVKLWAEPETPYVVMCHKCGIVTEDFPTEAEAIEAWNRAMGERVAKVVTEGKPIEGSDNYIAVTCCDKCGNVVSLFDTYCSGCGCRLEWK